MTRHTSDINSHVLNISYHQISFYLKANGWIHEKTIADIDIYSLEFGQSACKMLLPHDDQSEDYKHRLADILLILQMTQSPSLEDISWQIKKFCTDFITQEQMYE